MKNKRAFLVLVLAVLTSALFAQSNKTLYPVADAQIGWSEGSYSWYSDYNFGAATTMCAYAWTWSGCNVLTRMLINFDFRELPKGAIITGATLTLYSNGTHEGPWSGRRSNQCWVKQIITPWEENTVTWNKMPNITNNYLFPERANTSANQNDTLQGTANGYYYGSYQTVDFTELVRRVMYNPGQGYGFEIVLQDSTSNSNYARKAMYTKESGQNTSPKLVITYTTTPLSSTTTGTTYVQSETYDDDGQLHGQNITYYDNFGNSIQSIVRNFTNNCGIVSHNIYDQFGRVVAQAVPASADITDLNYRYYFMLNQNNNPFTYSDIGQPLSSSYGDLSIYYSENNLKENLVPRTSYPYMSTEYSPYKPNTVRKARLADGPFQTDATKAVKSWTMPAPEEELKRFAVAGSYYLDADCMSSKQC